ncbi:coatomer subunit epsilon [Thraustotheca clavata]|uniref:Coatomer subunit epsilon n=1 Tax=Thraustotheca clavata TaxID=74557 RepID=A0A1V9Z7W8_9STRA|nr:coatomer subunit epsilon [Thraustotheca clavata]
MSEPDELFTLKNQLWVGNYRSAIQEGTLLNHIPEAQKAERDAYVLRAQLGLRNYSGVLAAIPDDASSALNAIKLYATYLNGGDAEIALLTLREWLSNNENGQLLLIAGLIFMQEHKFSDALSALMRGRTLEHSMYVVLLYLKMDRIDLAEKHVQDMKRIDEDATCTQLAKAWTMVAKGGAACDEAALHFQELGDRFGASPLLLNGAAAAYMGLLNFTEAERLLHEALAKDPTYEDTFVNLIAVSQHLKKDITQYIAQLQQLNPKNEWLEGYKRLDSAFSRMAESYS